MMLPCRLLRNRVSAQQARERKKSYVSNLEQQAKGNEQTVRSHTHLHGDLQATTSSCTVICLCTVVVMVSCPLAQQGWTRPALARRSGKLVCGPAGCCFHLSGTGRPSGVAVCCGMGFTCRHAHFEGTGLLVQIAKLQQQVKTLERENGMLRQIIKNIQNPGDRSVPEAH